ncbi:MAG: phospholipid carrier-dependent glycosyltransferase [Endomicrobiales bacterium]|nr:phospholipid carrier-dependent glycosyltransferase [Endomicrobiales bacterium]
MKRTPDKPLIPAKTGLMEHRDWLTVTAMTFVYLLICLYNLGTTIVPKTGIITDRYDETFTVNFGRQVQLSTIYLYWGVSKGDAKVSFYYPAGKGDFKKIDQMEIKAPSICRWDAVSAHKKLSRLKVNIHLPGAAVNEIVFFDFGTKKPIRDFYIEDKTATLEKSGPLKNLFDEEYALYKNYPFFQSGTIFDEVYYPRTAYEYLRKKEPTNWMHPPLGKLLIAPGIIVFGMTPFGWRIMGVLFGVSIILLMYVFAKRIFANTFYAFSAAYLMMFDFMNFTHSRTGLLDVYLVFFLVLMSYLLYLYFEGDFSYAGRAKNPWLLFCAAFFFGCAVSIKWSAVLTAAGFAAVILVKDISGYIEHVGKLDPADEKQKKTAGTLLLRRAAFLISSFTLIPAAVYLLAYAPYIAMPDAGHTIMNVVKSQWNILKYHANLSVFHGYCSTWWQWPLMTKPLLLYRSAQDYLHPGRQSVIFIMGNPAVWWVSIAAVPLAVYLAFKRREEKIAALLTVLGFTYIPWIFAHNRPAFIYYFYPAIPFCIFAIVYVMKWFSETYPRFRNLSIFYLGIVEFLFIVFYPVISGMLVRTFYIEQFKWLKSWYF